MISLGSYFYNSKLDGILMAPSSNPPTNLSLSTSPDGSSNASTLFYRLIFIIGKKPVFSGWIFGLEIFDSISSAFFVSIIP